MAYLAPLSLLYGGLTCQLDHSFMHDDFHPYYVSKGTEEVVTTNYDLDPAHWMIPMKHAPKSGVVEIPGG